MRTWVGLMATGHLLDAALDDRLQDAAGVSHPSYGILAMLSSRANHSAHMHELAIFTSQSQSRLSHAVTRLERRGLVSRARCRHNARYVDATLTDRGLALITAAAPAHVEEVRRLVFDRLSAEQVEQLAGITTALLEGLHEAGYHGPNLIPRNLGRGLGSGILKDQEEPAVSVPVSD